MTDKQITVPALLSILCNAQYRISCVTHNIHLSYVFIYSLYELSLSLLLLTALRVWASMGGPLFDPLF